MVAASLLACGCAPLARYAGPAPAPGVPGTAASNALAPGSRDGERLRIGALAGDAAEGRVVLIYGDNRPGFRMESQRWEYHALRRAFREPPVSVLRGLVALPLAVAELAVPALNGPRDLVTLFTGRPTGGGEGRVLRALEREPRADLVVSTGDVVTDGRRGRLWEDFARRSRALRERAPYVAAPGNHERLHDARGRAGWEAVAMPALQPGRAWGVLEDPATGATWVFLDSNVLADPHARIEGGARRAESLAQLAWADSVLARPARFRFVVLHHPLVGAGHYETDWSREGEGEAAENRRRLLALCLERGVHAVFAGHEHLYQRLWVAGPGGRGFWHVTTGGGGSPLYVVSRGARERAWAGPLPGGARVDPASAAFRSDYHFLRLAIPARGAGGDALPLAAARVTIGGDAVVFDSLDLARAPGAGAGPGAP